MMPDLTRQGPPPVIAESVQHGLCSGCGVCAAVCPDQCLEMQWDEYGMRVPREHAECQSRCGLCVAVCPFGHHGVTEDDLAQELFGAVSGATMTDALGYCLGAYVGHVATGTCRSDGSSGGVARWFLASLLEAQHVERVLCVMPGPNPANLFRFAEVTSADTVRAAAKSAYYPADIAEVLQAASRADGRFAIIALPCVVKAVRLAARRIPELADSVGMVAGLVCGQLKSRGFADYLARHVGVAPEQLRRVSFREKAPERPASDFHFLAVGENESGSVGFASAAYGGTHSTGQFKLRACDVCDDVFAETADIAFMDAWLPAYSSDPQGTSIVLTRSTAADSMIREGIDRGELDLRPIPVVDVLRSQAGRIKKKRHTLAQRLWMMEAAGESHPPKRVQPVRPGWYDRLLLAAHEQVRQASHEAMRRQREVAPVGLEEYHRLMRSPLRRLLCLRACAPGRIRRLPSGAVRRAKKLLGALRAGKR